MRFKFFTTHRQDNISKKNHPLWILKYEEINLNLDYGTDKSLTVEENIIRKIIPLRSLRVKSIACGVTGWI